MDWTSGMIARKRKEIDLRKNERPMQLLEKRCLEKEQPLSLTRAVSNPHSYGIIAECRRFSPNSDGLLKFGPLSELLIAFASAGASALCIHTDSLYGGYISDLSLAEQFHSCPRLQYDFLVEDYQLFEARAFGADAIVLIPDLLGTKQLEYLTRIAQSLGLEIVLEIRGATHLDDINPNIHSILVNNRNQQDSSEADIAKSWQCLPLLPSGITKISWGGLNEAQSIVDLKHAGYYGFIMGTHFLREENPGAACRNFIQKIKDLDQLLQGAIA